MHYEAIWPLTKEAFKEWSEDKASRLAAALAYYTAISLAPLLVLAVTVLGWMNFDGRMVVENQMGMLMGSTGKTAAKTMIEAAKEQSGFWPTVISIVVLLFGASGVFAELQDSLNTIWEVQPDPKAGWWETIKKRFLSLTMVLGVIFLLLVSLVLSTVLAGMVGRFAGEGKVVGLMLDIVISMIVYVGVFALLFKYLPDVKIKFKDVWLGAVLTAVLFTIGKYALTLYLTKGSTASAYGAAGSLAALLIWVYYAAQILFFGAEFTRVYALKYENPLPPDRGAVPMTEEQRAQRGIVREHDLEVAKAAELNLSAQRGAVYPPQAVPDRRVVTITRPTPAAQQAYAVAGMGLAAGFVVGALGMLTGRKYTGAGLHEIALNERLDRLEKRFGRGDAMRLHSRQLNVHERLDEIEARNRQAQDALRRRARRAAGPSFFERFSSGRRQPTWTQRLSEMFSKN
jgi:membrane protein